MTNWLKSLQDQKRQIEADMDAYLKSNKSYDEFITFLQP